MSKILGKITSGEINGVSRAFNGFGANLFYQQGGDVFDSTTITIPSNIQKYGGGVLAADGSIYCMPNRGVDKVLKINPFDKTAADDGPTLSPGTQGWNAGTLTPSGKIYCAPRAPTEVLIINTANSVYDTTTISGLAVHSNKSYGTVYAPSSNKLYCAPYISSSGTFFLIIDLATDTPDSTTISVTGSGTIHFTGGVLTPNGKIYFPPADSDHVLIVDPVTDTPDTTTIAGLGTSRKYAGGVLAPNGKIYCVPRDATNVLIIDTADNTPDTTTISGLSGSGKWFGGVLAPNGKIYFIPHSSTVVGIVDPDNDTIDTTSITGLTGSEKYIGGVLAPTGDIYCIPYEEENVGILSPAGTPTLPLERCVSLHYNKLT